MRHFTPPRRALVIEAESLIRIDLEQVLSDMGFEAHGFGHPDEGLAALDRHAYQLAVIDLGFADQSRSLDLAAELTRRQVGLVFCSGLSTAPEAFRHVPFVSKPYSFGEIAGAIARVSAGEV